MTLRKTYHLREINSQIPENLIKEFLMLRSVVVYVMLKRVFTNKPMVWQWDKVKRKRVQVIMKRYHLMIKHYSLSFDDKTLFISIFFEQMVKIMFGKTYHLNKFNSQISKKSVKELLMLCSLVEHVRLKTVFTDKPMVYNGLLICMFMVQADTLVVPILDNVVLKWKQSWTTIFVLSKKIVLTLFYKYSLFYMYSLQTFNLRLN